MALYRKQSLAMAVRRQGVRGAMFKSGCRGGMYAARKPSPCPGPSGSAARAPGRVHAAPTAQRKRDVRPFPTGCRGGLQAARERCPARDLPGWPPAPRAAYTRPLRPDGKGMSGHSRQDVGAACRPPGSAALPGTFRVGLLRPGPRTRGPYGQPKAQKYL